MMAEHTPGPWRFTTSKEVVPDYYISRKDTGSSIARLTWPSEANARLIAAAPELLGALKECLAYLSAVHEGWRCATEMSEKHCHGCQAIVRARTAIDKVEGASPQRSAPQRGG